MYCRKCNNKVFVDEVFSELNHLELFCVGCSKRWMIEKGTGVFSIWLTKRTKSLI